MKSGLAFLIAARQCEIAELEHLARTSELVRAISRFTHALQRERGICSIFLTSQGRRFRAQRHEQVVACEQAEHEVRAHFDRLDTDTTGLCNGARLFARLAVALHAMDALGGLRRRIGAQALAPQESTDAFARLIACLLAVVFEAVDSATDPEISRVLVAMVNFMQGKEFAGQERALGAGVFASGSVDAKRQQQWQHLIESQSGCFQVFAEFSGDALLPHGHPGEEETLAELERLRRIGGALQAHDTPGADLSQTWYDCCTRRIDAMKTVEDMLAARLRRLCERKTAQARADLRDHEAIVQALARQARAAPAGTAAPYGPRLERSILEMVQEQSRRLQAMGEELDTVRAALNERKVVERAKGLLMQHRRLSEEDAYKALRQTAMNQKRRLIDVAEAVLSMADVLPQCSR